MYGQLDGDQTDRVRVLALEASKALPEWRRRIFDLHFAGQNQSEIARELGISRSTVRSALDGIGLKRAGPGAIETVGAKIAADLALTEKAKAIVDETENDDAEPKPLYWFRALENRPEMITALSLLLVADALSDDSRCVPVAAVHAHFPKSLVSSSLALLRARGFAWSDGKQIHIVKTPCTSTES